MSDPFALRRIGLVVHPVRPIDAPLEQVATWGERRGVEVVQVPVPGQSRRVAPPGEGSSCDLIVSIGGDGTMLAGIRAAMTAGRPAMGIACGSLGVLTTVPARAVGPALDRVAQGDWAPRSLPVLEARSEGQEPLVAINDLVVARAGIGQIRFAVHVDGTLYARLAGDGCVISTPLGSSAYGLAAGGPLLTPDTPAFVLTPLPTHGGSRQPLVLSGAARLTLAVEAAVGGSRIEVDGQHVGDPPQTLSVTLRPDRVTLVGLPDAEPMFAALRRRRIIADSPRLVAEAERAADRPPPA
jgi:NAD+ kinase